MKEKFFRGVVRHRVAIVVTFVVMALAGLVARQAVGVNYDMNDYLPEQTASTRALDVMGEQFEGDIPNARVMVPDVTIPEAISLKDQLGGIEGVEEVTWLDDVASLEEPLEVQDGEVTESYYKDGCALFTLTIEEDARIEACDEIRALLGDGAAMTGSAVSTAVATKSTVGEVGVVAVCAVAFILLVLILTTTSWLDPLLVLVGLGVAVAINGGTNLMFGTISFVTNAAGSILQLAISLDFSVFLLHRFRECRRGHDTVQEDMVSALCKSSTAILSSGCAVMIGFLALTVMQFGIGPDLGFALAKGILVSLVTVFTFTPALLVICDSVSERLAHRPFTSKLKKFSNVVQKACIPLACAFVLLPVPAYLASTSPDISYHYGSSRIFGEGTTYGDDTAMIEEVFGQQDTYVALVPAGDVGTESELSSALRAIPQVRGVVSYVDSAGASIPVQMAPKDVMSKLRSESYDRMVLTVDAAYEGEETFELVEQVRQTLEAYYPGEYLLAGEGVSTTDLMKTITEDKGLVDMIAVVAVLAVLLVATRSLALPFILVFAIETSIWANFALPCLTGAGVFYLAYLIVSSIQLGVTVDYAILFADRYREMRRSYPKRVALRNTICHTTIPILTSGVVLVVVGFALHAVSSHGILSQLGYFLGIGVSMSLLAVLFVLPGYLLLLDSVIAKTTWKSCFRMDRKGMRRHGE